MERLTTDTPKNNLEMALNLFYVKGKEVWVRGYGKDGADISLLNLTREILSHQCPYVEPGISDDDLIMMMPEWLFDDVRATEHVIGLLYQAAWVCAELREHLKQFEDTELRPGKVSWMKEVFEIAFGNDTSRIERVHNLHVADKEGRVVVLPCKVGDTIWVTGRDNVPREMELEAPDIRAVCTDEDNLCMATCNRKPDGFCTYRLRNDGADIGKTVFLTREEAEKALREME